MFSLFRYTGQRILDVVEGKRDVEDVFYLRPSVPTPIARETLRLHRRATTARPGVVSKSLPSLSTTN